MYFFQPRLAPIVVVTFSFLMGSTLALGQTRIAETSAKTKPADMRLFALEDVRPGMKGVARTVFAGSEPEEFGVEFIGVLPGVPTPRQSIIIARLIGSNVDKTGVF